MAKGTIASGILWTLFRGILFLVVFLITLNAAFTLVVSPVYDFPESTSFKGEQWFNPYEGLDSTKWKRSNFQVQSKAWGGVTNGMNNSNERVFELYESLGYDIITISDYMKINRYTTDKHPLIPVYEHGYGIRKTHQVCVGAKDVLYFDYPLFQTKNTKQFILNRLKEESELVAIAHPALRGAYTHSDLATLTGYECIEVLNALQHSVSHWDAALTAGHPVYIMANDDAHDLDNQYQYGRCFTALNMEEITEDNVVEALSSGKSYGLLAWSPDADGHEYKKTRFKDIPALQSVQIQDQTLTVRTDRPFSEVRFIGNQGAILATIMGDSATHQASYELQETDPYVRAEIVIDPGHVIYTNPVMRSENGMKPTVAVAKINWPATILYRAFFFVLVAAGAGALFFRDKRVFKRVAASSDGKDLQPS